MAAVERSALEPPRRIVVSVNDPSLLLRRSLWANAVFSASSGLLFALGGDAIARLLGDLSPILVRFVAVQLVLFATALAWLASRNAISAPLTLAVSRVIRGLRWIAPKGITSDLAKRGTRLAA